MKAASVVALFMAACVAQSQPPKGSVEGRVLSELNQRPIKNAPVFITVPTKGLTTYTDAFGRFSFPDLPQGLFNVQAGFGFQGEKANRLVRVGKGEHVRGVTLSLMPNGFISGHITNQADVPLPNCTVFAEEFRDFIGLKRLEAAGSASTGAAGEYQVAGLPPGKYYVLAECLSEIPLPHPLMYRGSPEIPVRTYAPRYYPGSVGFPGATRVVVAPEADSAGIDFRMSPYTGVDIKGHVNSSDLVPELVSRNPGVPFSMFQVTPWVHFDKSTGNFYFKNVLPGDYEIRASDRQSNIYARAFVRVGSEPLDPIELTMVQPPAITGTFTVNDETKFSPESIQIRFLQQDGVPSGGASAKPNANGAFASRGLMPGRWQLWVDGINAFFHSVSLGDQEISPFSFEVRPETAGPLRIVMSTRWAAVSGTVSGAPSGDDPVSVFMWAAEPDRQDYRFRITAAADVKDEFHRENLVPGRYHICAIEHADWTIMNNDPLKERLAGRCETVDLEEGGKSTVHLRLIAKQDMQRLLAEVDR
ncbi:MAG TPA: carboxypeptidase-like regulatory domain-containing protein [Bryobacteraceae bacterium]|nr:carboxypeptidase-like regulatory domain-containing protein [Bryobacteraceae bacterium]